jgi:hypothetical protein
MSWEFVSSPEAVAEAAGPFLASLTPIDLRARMSSSSSFSERIKGRGGDDTVVVRDKYKSIFTSSFRTSLDLQERARLSTAVTAAASLLQPYTRIRSLPWRIAVMDDTKRAESGYPHTHRDIIVLPTSSIQRDHYDGDDLDDDLDDLDDMRDLVNLLIHEKVHIYQRAFPAEAHNLVMNRWSYRTPGVIDDYRQLELGRRSNPDVTPAIFNGTYQRYTSASPESLADSKIWSIKSTAEDDHHPHLRSNKRIEYEHPYEAMAYVIADYLTTKKKNRRPAPQLCSAAAAAAAAAAGGGLVASESAMECTAILDALSFWMEKYL